MESLKTLYLKEQLKKHGYKFTGPRNTILEILVQSESKHLSPEEIYNLSKTINPDIGLATVYRTLMLLVQLGFVTKLDLDDGISRYELVKENEDHGHHHLICKLCGNVEEVEDDLLDALEQQIQKKYGFFVENHSVKFYGICKNCQYSG